MKTQSEITLWTGITAEDQAQAMFDAAYEWLGVVLKDEAEALEGIPLKGGFWQWWDIVWTSIDRAFIDSIQMSPYTGKLHMNLPQSNFITMIIDEKHLQSLWRSYHDIRFVPVNRKVINEGIRFQVRVKIKKQ